MTWGDDPHGRVPLQAADKEILQLVALGGADGGAKEPKQVGAHCCPCALSTSRGFSRALCRQPEGPVHACNRHEAGGWTGQAAAEQQGPHGTPLGCVPGLASQQAPMAFPPSAACCASLHLAQVAAMFENSNSVWVYDWPSGRLCSLLTGQLGNVATLSACRTLPHTIAAGSCKHIGRRTARLLPLCSCPVQLPALPDTPVVPALPALPFGRG